MIWWQNYWVSELWKVSSFCNLDMQSVDTLTSRKYSMSFSLLYFQDTRKLFWLQFDKYNIRILKFLYHEFSFSFTKFSAFVNESTVVGDKSDDLSIF